MKCKNCDSEEIKLTLTPTSIHYGRLDCKQCGTFLGWEKDPNSPRTNSNGLRIGKRKIEQICKFHKMDKEICFFCLRDRTQLGYKETLTGDHIVELNKGGEDIIENMQVLCSACHKLKNWARLYLHWHLSGGGE